MIAGLQRQIELERFTRLDVRARCERLIAFGLYGIIDDTARHFVNREFA